MRKLLSICMSAALAATALLAAGAAPVAAHSSGNPCHETFGGVTYAVGGIRLHDNDLDTSPAIEFCLQRNVPGYGGLGDRNFAGASTTGAVVINLRDYDDHLIWPRHWQDAAASIRTRMVGDCVTTRNSAGSTFKREVKRLRLYSQPFNPSLPEQGKLWETTFDGTWTLPFGWADQAEDLVVNIISC